MNNFKTILSVFLVLLLGVAEAIAGSDTLVGVNEDLINAAKNADLPELKRLLDNGADVNARGDKVAPALHLASSNGHLKVVETLLAKGADVNSKDVFGILRCILHPLLEVMK